MDFLQALSEAAGVIRENQNGTTIEEIYLHEPKSQTQVFIKTMLKKNEKVGTHFVPIDNVRKDLPLMEQIFLGGFLDKNGQGKYLSLDDIFGKWEVCIKRVSRQTIKAKSKGASDV